MKWDKGIDVTGEDQTSAKKYSARPERLRQSGPSLAERSETTRWRVTPDSVSIQYVGLYIVFRSLLYYVFTTISNRSIPLERICIKVGTGTDLLQRFLPHENPDHCHCAGYTTKNPELPIRNCSSN
jgi:hypothetical protein